MVPTEHSQPLTARLTTGVFSAGECAWPEKEDEPHQAVARIHGGEQEPRQPVRHEYPRPSTSTMAGVCAQPPRAGGHWKRTANGYLASGLPVLGLIHTTGPKVLKLAGKYGPLVPVLRRLILREDTPLALR
jgi:hypothetical protein